MPDSASEPDPELHEPTPCKPVPLEDDQGDANVKDFSADGWPEARPEPRHLAPQLGHLPPQASPHMAPSGLLPPPHGGWVSTAGHALMPSGTVRVGWKRT